MALALVTGAAIRVGRAIALQLAQDGFDIALHYHGSEQAAKETASEIQQLGVKALLIQSNLAQAENLSSLIPQAQSFGELKVLVNSAAIFPSDDTLENSHEHWDRVLNVNLKAPLMLSQAFAQLQHNNAHIINILDARIKAPAGDHLVYRLTKSALWHLTESLAKELAPKVQVNGLALGAIMAPPGASEDHFKRMANQIPLQRTGSPEAVAEAVSFLVSQNFITGAVLPIDGGEFL
ncbi:SDR family oxidoreductase [Kangiella sp. TOML190]|uniref:SDR family oxidoreductase n=1 Tax=Kangiella sp. TOML190 TaxID=2931351 RepID=UPI00203EBCB2|nr:SDR family oxidoreductase [Kangiella sp. TOML190]